MPSFQWVTNTKSKAGLDLSSEINIAPFQKNWEVIQSDHGVKSPRDAASGLATGRRQHLPMILTIEIGRLTPLFLEMVFKNDTIEKMEIKTYSPRQNSTAASAAGKPIHIHSTILTHATVCEVRTVMRNIKNPDNNKYEMYQDVSFTYQKIESIYKEGNITGQDDWLNQG